jgi:hypothetical protein
LTLAVREKIEFGAGPAHLIFLTSATKLLGLPAGKAGQPGNTGKPLCCAATKF